MKIVIAPASIQGPHTTPIVISCGFGVRVATRTRQPRLVQKWFGHRSLDKIATNMDAHDEEEREFARRMRR